ncbi:DNA adenine methylase [Enterococcus sp. AZ109]|uniref:DNA adenine methylase n=1 Tax=Enterococcus sp. AZ109 TaxID=2774634 RepID=UPI003F203DB6
MKRIFNYPGAKWTLQKKIVPLIPEHTTYVEPFFGSGAVFFNKPVSKIETINDLNGRVINFFEICREKPEELARLISLTPLSRHEQQAAYEVSTDPLEDARRFAVIGWQSIGGVQKHPTGWRSNIATYGSKNTREWSELPERIYQVADRLKFAQIENQDAMQLLSRYNKDGVVAYVDPPYLTSLRSGKYYQTELEDERHLELLGILNQFKGQVILSGYENSLYDQKLSDWIKVDFQANAERGTRKEVVWMNFEPTVSVS